MTRTTKLTLAALGTSALAFGATANAATVFDSTVELSQSTTESPGYDGQAGQAGLTLNDDGEGNYSLAMSITFTDGLDFSGIVASGQVDTVLGENSVADDAALVTGFHIHNAPRGASGPVVFSFFDTALGLGTSDTDGETTLEYNEDGSTSVTTEWDYTEGTADGLLSDFVGELLAAADGEDVSLYLNLHTAAAAEGLIRGQIVAVNNAPIPVPAALPLFGTALAGGAFLRRRRAKA